MHRIVGVEVENWRELFHRSARVEELGHVFLEFILRPENVVSALDPNAEYEKGRNIRDVPATGRKDCAFIQRVASHDRDAGYTPC